MDIDDNEEFRDSGLYIDAIEIDHKKIDRHSYLEHIKPIKNLSEFVFRSPITIFTGENGSGKSTLIEAMAISCGFNPEGGTFNYSFSTHDSHSELHEAMRVIRNYRRPEWGYFLRAESFYNVATMDIEYARRAPGGICHEFHNMSHGESFLETISVNFRDGGLYFLDEPEAALSPQNQMALLVRLCDCAKNNSQIILATHSPILLVMPGADIYSFEEDEIISCRYEDTQSYRIMKMFVNDHEKVLKQLLNDE